MVLFTIKQQPRDFIVKEHLVIPWEGTGEYLYVYFQKENKNTMDIVHWLHEQFWLSRKEIWLSWLKDKKAITSQWISFSKDIFKKTGSKDNLLQYLSSIWNVLETTYWSEQLRVWSHTNNTFSIRLRWARRILPEEKEQITKTLIKIQKEWFPNTYWKQRFWKQQRNYKRAVQILEEYNKTQQDSYQQTFALQAYASHWFNEYLYSRWNEYTQVLSWAILEDWIPTWPVIWWKLQLPEQDSEAWKSEKEILKKSRFEEFTPWLKNFWIRWRRRKLYVKPSDFSYKREWKDIHICFNLPVWSYATSLVDHLINTIV